MAATSDYSNDPRRGDLDDHSSQRDFVSWLVSRPAGNQPTACTSQSATTAPARIPPEARA
jgi:hypothetical protein